MSLRILIGISTCLLVAAVATSSAQGLVTVQFEGKVTALTANQQVFKIFMYDEVSGSLTFDPFSNLQSTSSEPSMDRNSYDLKTGSNAQFIVSIGEHLFASRPANQMADEDGFWCDFQREKVTANNNSPTCRVKFQNSVADQMSQTLAPAFEMNFERQNCHRHGYVNELASFTQTTDWDKATIKILVREDGHYAGFVAEITSFKFVDVNSPSISGTMFMDENSNCEADDAHNLGRRVIKITPGPFHAIVNSAGEYSIQLPSGTYEAHIAERPLWKFTCVDGPTQIRLGNDNQSVEAHYAFEPTQMLEALDVSLAAGRARPGFPMEYCIRLENVGTLPYSGSIRFEHDALLTDVSSAPEADWYSAPTAEWHIAELPIGTVQVIKISTMVPADETLLGTMLCSRVMSEVDRKSEDEILSAASDEICTEIRGAYDPNDIQVFSGIQNADGPISQDNLTLTYLIRFQNEGNEDALTVRVVDALSQFHKIESLQFGAASHPAEISFNNEGELVWTFNDINLPPKSVDENASQGFVKFKVKLKDELAIGTEIPNSAAIHFDFNSPVITNTVVSRITNTTTSVGSELDASQVKIYPNPSSDRLRVRLDQPGLATLSIRNLLGQTVFSESSASAVHDIDLSQIPPGSYFLRVETEQGSLIEQFAIQR